MKTHDPVPKKSDIEIPDPPAFMRRNNGYTAVHIKYLSDKELREIGEKWTLKLLEMAAKARGRDPLADLGL